MEKKVKEMFSKMKSFKTPVAMLIIVVLVSIITCMVTLHFVKSGSMGANNVQLEESQIIKAAEIAKPSVVMIKVSFKDQNILGEVEDSYGYGSGVIFSEDGYIITNAHVIETAITNTTAIIDITLDNGDMYEAKVIGYDVLTDLAVIKVDTIGLTPAKMGSSSVLKVGQYALVIGTPLGKQYAGSVTVGHISGINRAVEIEGRQQYLIQTDAHINHGNSGGALVDSQGKVIGINSAKIDREDVEAMGFAIPIDEALVIVDKLIKDGSITRPFIGITGIDLDEATAKRNKLTRGVYVSQVFSDTPAATAKLQKADVITAVDGVEVKTRFELNDERNKKAPGDKITLKVYRKGEILDIEITLADDKNASIDSTN